MLIGNQLRTIRIILFFVVISFNCFELSAQSLFETSFAKGKWNQNEWIMVKSPRWCYLGKWIQKYSFIENKIPESTMSKENPISFTSMVLKNKFTVGISIKVKMEFADRMAPLIVIAQELGKNKYGYSEYREHFEIVLWDNGSNIWHHYFEDNKPSWKLVAYNRFPLKANTEYELEVKYLKRKTDKILVVLVDGYEFGYVDNSLPNEFYIGITGCEGANRFYNIEIRK